MFGAAVFSMPVMRTASMHHLRLRLECCISSEMSVALAARIEAHGHHERQPTALVLHAVLHAGCSGLAHRHVPSSRCATPFGVLSGLPCSSRRGARPWRGLWVERAAGEQSCRAPPTRTARRSAPRHIPNEVSAIPIERSSDLLGGTPVTLNCTAQ